MLRCANSRRLYAKRWSSNSGQRDFSEKNASLSRARSLELARARSNYITLLTLPFLVPISINLESLDFFSKDTKRRFHEGQAAVGDVLGMATSTGLLQPVGL